MTTGARSTWMAALVVAALAAIATAVMARGLIGHAPLYDELLHIEAAEGILATGEPRILDGEYRRAHAYSVITAWALAAGDGSLSAARIPAVLATVLLAALLGLWATRRLGAVAGTAAVASLLLLPLTPQLAVFARFYTLHALCCFLALICAYELTRPRDVAARVLLSLTAVLAAALAMHLQATSVIALGSGAVALAAAMTADRWDRAAPFIQANWGKLMVGALVLGGLALAAGVALGLFGAFFQSALWASGRNVQFYNALLRSALPLLWPLLPAAALLCVLRHRKLGVFCLVAFGLPLLLHSLAAQKTFRYIYYAMPFACVLWGAGLSVTCQGAINYASRYLGRAGVAAAAVAAVILGAVILSAEGTMAAKLLAGRIDYRAAFPTSFEADWEKARAAIRTQIRPGTTIVASSGVKAVNLLGDYHYELNASVVLETETGEEFGRDPRTGRHVIGTHESLAEVLSQPGPAIVIADTAKLGNPNHIGAAVVDHLNAGCEVVPAPRESAVTIWKCVDR